MILNTIAFAKIYALKLKVDIHEVKRQLYVVFRQWKVPIENCQLTLASTLFYSQVAALYSTWPCVILTDIVSCYLLYLYVI